MMYQSAGGKKHGLLIVDEATDYAHSFFLKKKSDMIETIQKSIHEKHHIRIKQIIFDNSRENRMLQAKSDQQNLGIKFEFTAPETPQKFSGRKKICNINGKCKSYDEPCWY